jgi:hypothetical protein
VSLIRRRRGSSGFTLVELVVALGLTLVLALQAHRLILAGQRTALAQSERAAVQDNVRAGALIVANELRELGFDSVPAVTGLGLAPVASSDILSGQPGRIRYRAFRGLGFTCLAPSMDRLLVRSADWLGARRPVAGVDSVALYVEGNPAVSDDDAWVRARIAGVSVGQCPDGTEAIDLAIAWEAPALGAAAAGLAGTGGPVRIFEVMELAYYRSEGASWLGQRSVSRGEVIQPVVGPLADSTSATRGFALAYLDSGGAAAAVPAAIRTVEITLRGVTARPVRTGRLDRAVVDTFALQGRVTLRNTRRP